MSSSSPAPPGAVLPPTITPMKSRQKLLAFFAFILAFWIAMMVTMYFATVYPHRHPSKGATQPAVVPAS